MENEIPIVYSEYNKTNLKIILVHFQAHLVTPGISEVCALIV